MKILLSLSLALLCLGAEAQTFVNTNTGQYSSALPNGLLIGGNWLSNPNSNQLVAAGWLTVSNTVAPSAGWVTTSNAIVPYVPINGWCQLVPGASNNIQAQFNANITNSPLWSAGLVTTLTTWRSVLRAYDGFGAESNSVVNWATASNFFATNQPFLQIPTNAFNANWLLAGASQITQLPGITNTAQFWQLGLIP